MNEALPKSIRVECNAKINLYLRVAGKRDDGYHDIETVFHSVKLYDTLTLTRMPSGLTLSCSDPSLPVDMDNIALRAAARMIGFPVGPQGISVYRAGVSAADMDGSVGDAETQDLAGVHITLEKRIPVGAGLGGGSADAAGTLIGLNELFRLGHPMSYLENMAADLGADVKFMLSGGCAIGRGRGDELTPLPPLSGIPVVLVIPPISVSSGWAYSSLKMGLTSHKSRLSMVASALGKGDIASLCDLLHNDFEGLICDRFPSVGKIKDDLLGCGALGSLMSGSGPVVFGIFSEVGDAEACRAELAGRGTHATVVCLDGRGVTVSR